MFLDRYGRVPEVAVTAEVGVFVRNSVQNFMHDSSPRRAQRPFVDC